MMHRKTIINMVYCSETQPMDMGGIANFNYYRTEIIKRYLVDTDNSMPTYIDVLTA